jgi:hypothetical protein
MHVHAPHNVSVADQATTPTGPIPSSRLLLPIAPWTVAAGSSLTAAEAHDADLLTFLLEILLVLAIFPLTHALVVMAPLIPVAHSVRIAHVERLHPLRSAEVDHLAHALVPQVAHSALFLAEFACFGILQTPPTFEAFVAACLQPSEPSEHHVVASLEAADTAPGDDQPLASGGRHRGLVDLTQVDGSLHRWGSRS